jgi:hypothetical protein
VKRRSRPKSERDRKRLCIVPKLIMPRGSRTVIIFYPGRIRMPERTAYLVRLGDKIGSLLLYRHLKPVEALDFSNSLQRTERDGRMRWELQRPITMATEHNMAMESEGQLIYVFEDGVQYYRLFRPRDFTEIFIVHDVEDTANLTDEEKSRHERIAERFLMAYRAFTGDISVRMPNDLATDYPVIRAGLHEYTEEELRAPEHERITSLRDLGIRVEAVPLGINPHVLTPPAVDVERAGPLIQRLLASGDSVPEPQAMLVKAVEELKIGQDHRYSLLLAFFSIEQVVTEFLEDIKGRAGISDKTIKSYRGDIGMSYKINVELPLVLRPDDPVRQLIPALGQANGLRNQVVHKGRDVTFAEAGFVINVGDQLIKGLSGEPTAVPIRPDVPG